MRNGKIMDQMEPPRSVEEVVGLARYGAAVVVTIRPQLDRNEIEPGRKHPSFRLSANYSVKVGGRISEFEKIYAKGHEAAPPRSAANGFTIANTRLRRDVRDLEAAGARCDLVPFILAELLPGTDLGEFEPRKPYYLDQFAILAGLGLPVAVAVATCTRPVEETGGSENELCALYSIYCRGEQYRVETAHGRYPVGADEKTIARVQEVAVQRLNLEQHKLRRVGVEIEMEAGWRNQDEFRPLHLAPQAIGDQGNQPISGPASLQIAHGK